ncbi:MAG TPA: chemotaxis protein CheA [Desulfuromonadales bacterium]|nr:chemotaxis protein CheA [Desulfuromonadales bacterium]
MPPIDSADQELLEGFLAETMELLDKLDEDLVALEKASDDAELLNRIFRSIHTIKGASSFLGFDLLVKVAHTTEDVLNRLRKLELTLTPEIMDAVLEATDLVKLLVSDIKAGDIQERETGDTISRLLPFLTETDSTPRKEPSTQPQQSAPIPVTAPLSPQPPDAMMVALAQPSSEGIPRSVTPHPKVLEGRGEELYDNTTVRVDVTRLDDLLDQVGELVLERNRMIQLNQDLSQGDINQAGFQDEFGKLTKRISFVTSELQMQVLKMRMIPVEKVFRKFPRIVRNVARDLAKEVDLRIMGEETELDRSIIDEIGDPLIHLIRNALDHGLETPQERLDAGKQPAGSLILSAGHEGNHIVISIKDDGRGIDCDRVGRKAVEKGLLTDDQLASMSQNEILDLILLPGFSTKEKVSDLSGRGVGMDVVKTNIKKLNGIIEIRSERGQGSEFLLRLPLTLAIIQSLVVEVGREVYLVPLTSVLETFRVEPRSFHQIGGQEVLKMRDSVLPLIRMQRVFSIEQEGKAEEFCYVVVVGAADKRIGLVVNRLIGQQEVAIKSLGPYLTDVPGIAGSTILGDGRVALIVDPAGMAARND